MNAWVLYGINDLQLKEISCPEPRKGEVIVQVKAAGICSSDISRVYKNGAYHYPIILGHEFSGITNEGRRVGVFPLIPCHSCDSCRHHRHETCSNYSYIGSRQDGAFAEYVAVPEWNLITLPDHVTFEQGALLEPAAVALHAVKSAKLDGVVNAAVIGDGAIGRLIGVWLRYYGVKFIDVLGRKDNGSFGDYDLCFEVVGSSDAFRRCIELIRPNGGIILVGNPNSEFNIDQTIYWKILRKQLTVSGIWNSSYPFDWKMVLENINLLQSDDIITHKVDFLQLKKAFDMIQSRKEKYGKVMCVF